MPQAEEASLISVVIPTRQRADLLMKRALPSVLAQTYTQLEVIVVVDGPDEETQRALEENGDPRLRPVYLPHNVGGSDARNEGVRAARGEWVALLDDDDEWLPDKLADQLELARRSRHAWPIVSCRWISRTTTGDVLNPPTFPEANEPIGEYIYTRKGGLTSSTLLTATELLRRVPFTSGLPRHQDSDWLLRAGEVAGVGLELTHRVGMIYYQDQDRNQVSWNPKWRQSLSYAENHAHAGRLSRAAHISFVISYLAPVAARSPDLAAFGGILRELVRLRTPPSELLRYLAIWTLPPGVRRSFKALARRLAGRRKPADVLPAPGSLGPGEPTLGE